MNFLLLIIFVPPLAIAYALVIFGRRSFGRMWVSSARWPLGLALLIPVAMLVWGMLMNYSGPIDTEPAMASPYSHGIGRSRHPL